MLESHEVLYRVIELLVERDRLDVLRAEADNGHWGYGDALAKELLRRGETADALAVYRGFVGSSWGAAAVDNVVAILETTHGADAAIAFVRPYADSGDRRAVHTLALLLGRHGRTDEVITLLTPHLTDWFLVSALVEATAGGDRDEQVIAVLEDLVETERRQPDRWQAEPHNAALSLSAVLERRGRLSAAIDMLRRERKPGYVNEIERLAELLAKAGREGELRDLVNGKGRIYAAYRLADLLESQGRVAEAIEALRPFVEEGNTNAAFALADLLVRHGRVEEATDVLYAAVRSEGASHSCTRFHLWGLLIEAGRPDQALRLLDELERDFDAAELSHDRLWLLQELGHDEEALAPEADEDLRLCQQALTMADLGRLDEAIALLRPRATSRPVGGHLAVLLIRRGDIDEAMAVLHGREPEEVWPDPWADLTPGEPARQ